MPNGHITIQAQVNPGSVTLKTDAKKRALGDVSFRDSSNRILILLQPNGYVKIDNTSIITRSSGLYECFSCWLFLINQHEGNTIFTVSTADSSFFILEDNISQTLKYHASTRSWEGIVREGADIEPISDPYVVYKVFKRWVNNAFELQFGFKWRAP